VTEEPHYDIPPGGFGATLQQGLLFLWSKPKKVSFSLLLNTWGDDREGSVQGDLNFLKTLALARDVGDTGADWKLESSGYQFRYRPPVVMVVWSEAVIGVVTKFVINHTKWDPEQLVPVRATVELEVSEQVFFPEFETKFRNQAGDAVPVRGR